MSFQVILPKSIRKIESDLRRTREKSARHKHTLDLFESIVVHLSAFLLGEYRGAGMVNMDLEKEILKNNRNLSFGNYNTFLKTAGKVLRESTHPSRLDEVIFGKGQPVYGLFDKIFEAVKKDVLDEKESNLLQLAQACGKQTVRPVSMMALFEKIVQLRNKVAHSSGFEHKGKMLSWPQHDDYYDALNPVLEDAITTVLSELNDAWAYRSWLTGRRVQQKMQIILEEGQETAEVDSVAELLPGTRILLAGASEFIVVDWRLLKKASEQAELELRKEQELLRLQTDRSNIKEAIRAALDDGQISLEEFRFFESLCRTKLNVSDAELRTLIQEAANEIGISDPLPEIDLRYLQQVDEAIRTNSFNEFALKLAGTAYGVDSSGFEKLFLERCKLLNADPGEVRTNLVRVFTASELSDLMAVMAGYTWLNAMAVLNNGNSLYDITKGNAEKAGTKESNHRQVFLDLERFTENRVRRLCGDDQQVWETKVNQWQQGKMSGYAWCSIYPSRAITHRALALNVAMGRNGRFQVGFLPDYKDIPRLANYGAFRSVVVYHMVRFSKEYKEDLRKVPELGVVAPFLNFHASMSLSEVSEGIEWYFEHAYELEEIQFVLSREEVAANPYRMIELFDINFGLFNGLIPEIIRDYENALVLPDPFQGKEGIYKESLERIINIGNRYGVSFATVVSEDTDDADPEGASDQPSAGMVQEADSVRNWISGSSDKGFFRVAVRSKVEQFYTGLRIGYRSNVLKGELHFFIWMVCGGDRCGSVYHQNLNSILADVARQMNAYFTNGTFTLAMAVRNHDLSAVEEVVESFFRQLSDRLADAAMDGLQIKPCIPMLQNHQALLDTALNSCADKLNGMQLFANKINRQRNLMQRKRYVDFVYSHKKVDHWIEWGYYFREGRVCAGTRLVVTDVEAGSHLVMSMRTFSETNPEWVLVASESGNVGEVRKQMELSFLEEIEAPAGYPMALELIPVHFEKLHSYFQGEFGFGKSASR